MNNINSEILEELSKFESATIQNAAIFVRGYVDLGVDYSGPELQCMLPESGTLVGYAMTAEKTVLHKPEKAIGSTSFYDSIAEANVPTLAVIKDIDEPSNRGAVWGDEMAHILSSIGCIGGVIGGAVRDVPGTAAAGCGLWATGRVPGHGPSNIVRHGVDVKIAGLKISPGDILVCDADGVVIVPIDLAEQIIKFAKLVKAKEDETFRFFKQTKFTNSMYKIWRDNHDDGAWPIGKQPEIPGRQN